jgi:hypothetical protein
VVGIRYLTESTSTANLWSRNIINSKFNYSSMALQAATFGAAKPLPFRINHLNSKTSKSLSLTNITRIFPNQASTSVAATGTFEFGGIQLSEEEKNL